MMSLLTLFFGTDRYSIMYLPNYWDRQIQYMMFSLPIVTDSIGTDRYSIAYLPLVLGQTDTV